MKQWFALALVVFLMLVPQASADDGGDCESYWGYSSSPVDYQIRSGGEVWVFYGVSAHEAGETPRYEGTWSAVVCIKD